MAPWVSGAVHRGSVRHHPDALDQKVESRQAGRHDGSIHGRDPGRVRQFIPLRIEQTNPVERPRTDQPILPRLPVVIRDGQELNALIPRVVAVQGGPDERPAVDDPVVLRGRRIQGHRRTAAAVVRPVVLVGGGVDRLDASVRPGGQTGRVRAVQDRVGDTDPIVGTVLDGRRDGGAHQGVDTPGDPAGDVGDLGGGVMADEVVEGDGFVVVNRQGPDVAAGAFLLVFPGLSIGGELRLGLESEISDGVDVVDAVQTLGQEVGEEEVGRFRGGSRSAVFLFGAGPHGGDGDEEPARVEPDAVFSGSVFETHGRDLVEEDVPHVQRSRSILLRRSRDVVVEGIDQDVGPGPQDAQIPEHRLHLVVVVLAEQRDGLPVRSVGDGDEVALGGFGRPQLFRDAPGDCLRGRVEVGVGTGVDSRVGEKQQLGSGVDVDGAARGHPSAGGVPDGPDGGPADRPHRQRHPVR